MAGNAAGQCDVDALAFAPVHVPDLGSVAPMPTEPLQDEAKMILPQQTLPCLSKRLPGVRTLRC